ncbi:LCP family protein [Candidatus Saccharibacteria bacterium]|nr:LCP family protein [Candidatus Saccharibacteria bacterium]
MKLREEKKSKETSNLARYIFLIPLIAQFGASTVLMMALIRLNILQTWQLTLAGALLVALFFLNAYLLIIRRKGIISKVLALILCALIVAGCAIASNYVRSTTSFISNITGSYNQTQVYEVRALKDSGYTKLEELSTQKIGFISSNPNIEETKEVLKDDLNSYESVDYEEVGSLLAALYDREIAAVTISESYLDFLEDNESTFEDDTIVLHRMEIITEGEYDLREPVNIVEEPFIVYISGSDSRGTINDISDSDVNILAVVNPNDGKILLVNVPRDYEVQIYGTTGLTDKLKSAGLFGTETSKKTIEELLGVKINYVVKVGFQAIREIVDAIDGIDIDSDMDIVMEAVNEYKYCYINSGRIHLDGSCALAYSRYRKYLTNGDLDRGVHQQEVLTAIIDKVTDLHYVTRLPQILNAAKDTFQTSFTEKEITDFVRYQLAELKHWKTESIQIGTSEHVLKPTYTFRNQNMWLYLRDEASETKAKQKIAEYLGKSYEELFGESTETAGPEAEVAPEN